MRLPVVFIMITVTLDAMGIGLILPVMPDLIAEVRGVSIADAALWGGILSAAYAIMQFGFSPTDRLAVGPVRAAAHPAGLHGGPGARLRGDGGGGVDLAPACGRLVAGMAAATHATALAFMADITEPGKRAQNFGLISAGFGMGFILGPLLGGLLGDLDPRAPFVAAAILAALNFTFGWFVLPESLPQDRRRAFDWRRANPAGGPDEDRGATGRGPLLAVMLAYQISNFVYPAIWAYWTQEAFGWDARMVGMSLAAYGVAIAVVQAG
jgi:DHA1 family tetracycline resistance protein-like MFS transporter